MPQEASKPARTWQQIAEEASHEQDPERLVELAQELEHALMFGTRSLFRASTHHRHKKIVQVSKE